METHALRGRRAPGGVEGIAQNRGAESQRRVKTQLMRAARDGPEDDFGEGSELRMLANALDAVVRFRGTARGKRALTRPIEGIERERKLWCCRTSPARSAR